MLIKSFPLTRGSVIMRQHNKSNGLRGVHGLAEQSEQSSLDNIVSDWSIDDPVQQVLWYCQLPTSYTDQYTVIEQVTSCWYCLGVIRHMQLSAKDHQQISLDWEFLHYVSILLLGVIMVGVGSRSLRILAGFVASPALNVWALGAPLVVDDYTCWFSWSLQLVSTQITITHHLQLICFCSAVQYSSVSTDVRVRNIRPSLLIRRCTHEGWTGMNRVMIL